MSDEIILYDLPSRQATCWSLNPWKTRLVLNFKGIPYKTEWIEYPDVAPTFKKWGIPAHDPSASPYTHTSPTIRLPDGKFVMESRIIASTLDSQYPSPPLHLDSPYQARIETLMGKLVGTIRPLFVPLVPKTFLNPPSEAYYVSSREKALGMTLDEFYRRGADKGLEEVKVHVKELGGVLVENPGGPFLLGEEPCYADFVVVAWLKMMDGLGCIDRFFGMDGGEELRKLYGASKKWLERDT